MVQGAPALIVSDAARWTLNGFAKGYARKLNASGMLNDQPEDNIYVPVMEALECFVKWFDVSSFEKSNDSNIRYGTTSDGRRYLTSRSA